MALDIQGPGIDGTGANSENSAGRGPSVQLPTIHLEREKGIINDIWC